MIISLDTECTGLDLAHGAMPFLITWCETSQGPKWVEWPVDPMTRRPEVDESEVEIIADLLNEAELIYMQNAKYDARALANIGLELPWHKVRDTLIMGHLLATNHKHDLTSMVGSWFGIDVMMEHVEPRELLVKEVTRAARAIVKKAYPRWKIAEEGTEGMPSVNAGSKEEEDKPWKNDMWLPRAFIKAEGNNIFRRLDQTQFEKWMTACSQYACSDSEWTLYLGIEMERVIGDRGLWAIYEHRLQLPRVDCEMETYGVTVIGEYTESTIQHHREYVAEAADALCSIAQEFGHDLQLAKGAALNDNMRDFFYGALHQRCPRCDHFRRVKHWNGDTTNGELCPKCGKGTTRRAPVSSVMVTTQRDNLALPIVRSKKRESLDRATLDKDAMNEYITTLDEGPALEFVRILLDKRKHDTDLTYMEMYQRFWLPVPGAPGYYRLHPSTNPCGTDHLRQSCNGPNLQNIGGQEDKCDECDGDGCHRCDGTGKSRRSLKNCFGPAPGREWWTMDYKSIEARLPAYEAGEPKMIEVFERPNEPPYWGNLYNLTASVLYPEEYLPLAETEGLFRKDHPRLYKQAKFFVLAKNYGAGRKKGDLLSKIKNSYDLVDNEFPMLAALQAKYMRDADKVGYVETIPSRAIDPTRGYPILVAQTDEGRVLSTTPFNYHISGTACESKNLGMVRCADQCRQWRAEGFDAWLCLEIHDELLFDFPLGRTPEENLPRARVLQKLMEQSGIDLIPSIPTPVQIEYHARTWAEGVKF